MSNAENERGRSRRRPILPDAVASVIEAEVRATTLEGEAAEHVRRSLRRVAFAALTWANKVAARHR